MSVDQYSVQEEMANAPTLEEILAAIKSIKSGETPGLDGILAKTHKYDSTALHAQLLKFYRIFWTAKELSQPFKDALIIYKKKVDRSDYGNYRGISILSTAGKFLAKILLKRPLQRWSSRKPMWISSPTLNNNKDSIWSSLTCQKPLAQWTGQPCGSY